MFGFFLAFKQSVWPFSGLFSALYGFLLKLSSGNPGLETSGLVDRKVITDDNVFL